jgi:hypothetical protein
VLLGSWLTQNVVYPPVPTSPKVAIPVSSPTNTPVLINTYTAAHLSQADFIVQSYVPLPQRKYPDDSPLGDLLPPLVWATGRTWEHTAINFR